MTAPTIHQAGGKPFTIARTVAAPRERVWRAWTDPAELRRWFGPKGSSLPVCTMDLRPGGSCHYCMRTAEGLEMWGLWEFREVAAPETLVLVQSFSDAQGGIGSHPLSPTWPRQTRSTTAFTERAGHTTMEIRCEPWEATAAEQATFDGAHAGMQHGWSGTFDQLAAHLARA